MGVWRRTVNKQEKSLYDKAPCQDNVKRERELETKWRESVPLLQSQTQNKNAKNHSESENERYLMITEISF